VKILFLSHFPPWPPTGHGALQRTHHLLRRIAAEHEVHLLALVPKAAAPSAGDLSRTIAALEGIVASVHAFRLDENVVRKVWCAVRSLAGNTPYWEHLFENSSAHRALESLLRRHRFDLVHADIVFLRRYAWAARGTPLVLNHHNVESHLLERRALSAGHPLARRFFRAQASRVEAVERTLARRAAGNLLVSQLDEERLRVLAGELDTAVIANGVDLDFFNYLQTTGEPGHLVFAGGMDWFPNRDAMAAFAADTWPALVNDGHHRRLTVIGRNPPPELLALQSDSRVSVTGFVDDVRPYIERASIYVCPIRVGGGTRLKVLDALAMGRPLVSSDIGVEGLGLSEGEHYLRANSTAELIAQVRRLESDAELGNRLRTAGRAFVERHYGWDGIARRLESAYGRVMQTQTGRAPHTAGGVERLNPPATVA
jgi:glycosyltransferase involved in cell wall biosynthesis